MAQGLSPVDDTNLPAGSPPAGVLPDLVHGETRTLEGYIGIGFCIGISLIFMLLRFYVKFWITHLWGWDDMACLLGWMAFLCLDVLIFTMMASSGVTGSHVWNIRISRITKDYLQSLLASSLLFTVSAFFVKLSLFLLYLRLFKVDNITRWLIYCGITACALIYAASIIGNCLLCMPKPGQPDDSASWLLRAHECTVPWTHSAVAQAVFGTSSDIYLLVVPIQSILRLKLPVERKVRVGAIFMIGIVAIACSIGSIVYRVALCYQTDTTWGQIPAYIFNVAELSAGIITSCMPILAALFGNTTPRRFQFPTLRYSSLSCFAFRGFRSSPRLLVSKRNILYSDGVLHDGRSNHMELENGQRFEKPKNAIIATRGFESL